jgi:hypothetical protein
MPRTPALRALVGTAGTASTALLLAAALAACSSSSPAPAAAPASTTPAASSTPTPSVSPAQLVQQVGMSDADLANGYTVKLIPGGDQVAGQVTLDYCGVHFSSEGHRVARRQVEVLTAAGDPIGVSNEVVAYDTPQDALLALAQLRAAVTHCPKTTYVTGTVAGEPAMRYDVSQLTGSSALPAKDNAIATSGVSAKGQKGELYNIEVFQVHGSVLDGVYASSDTKPTADDTAGVLHLAELTGQRLVATSLI